METKILMTKTNLIKKEGTKTVYTETEKQTSEISEREYKNIVDSAPFFRRLGGSESLTRAYTSNGYCVIQIISTSPDRQNKTIRTFKFD